MRSLRLQTGSVLLGLSLGSCGAPSYNLFGAFFPGWMMCAAIGVFAALTARVLFGFTTASLDLPAQFLLFAALGVICGVVAWLVLG